jgi:hypothetical protein
VRGTSWLSAQSLVAGSVGNIDAGGNVAFSFTFDQAPDFLAKDTNGRRVFAFAFLVGSGSVSPGFSSPSLLSIFRTDADPTGAIVITNANSPVSDGTVRGRIGSPASNERTVILSIPAALLNIAGPFVYTLTLRSHDNQIASFTGTSGGPILFTIPLSIAHTVYRESVVVLRNVPSLGGKNFTPAHVPEESTIIFEDETRFIYLLYRQSSIVHFENSDGKLVIQPPKPNGTYRLIRTSNTLAQIELNFADGTSTTLLLTFINPAAGGKYDFDPNTYERSFSFSDLVSADVYGARNVSMRATISAGHPLVVGLITSGPREVVIRAVGPSLQPFGITTTWADPDFQLYQGSSLYLNPGRHNADWNAQPDRANGSDSRPALSKVFSYLGAFPLQDNGTDAADVLRLDAGTYSIVCAPRDAGGELLVEVYFLP